MAHPNESVKQRRPKWLLWMRLFVRLGLAGVVLATAVGGAGFAYVYKKYGTDLPDVSVLETHRPSQTTKILASDGSVITTLFQENRVWAPLDTISPWVGAAVVAIGDAVGAVLTVLAEQPTIITLTAAMHISVKNHFFT